MLRMKKGLAALAAACFLFVGTGKAQAVIGIPDNVPGESLLFPFFKINPNRTAANSQDTLLVITNTGNVGSLGAVGGDVIVHVSIWNVRSEHVYDFNITLTPHDVFSCSMYDILKDPLGCATEGVAQAPAIASTRLQATLNGETILAGYVTADVVTSNTALLPDNPVYPFGAHNILIGHEYIVDLPNGSATGLNAVSIEDTAVAAGDPLSGFGHPTFDIGGNLLGVPQITRGFYSDNDTLERFSGNNGDILQTLTPNASELDMIVRYFTASAVHAKTEIWLWKECNSSDDLDLELDGDTTECPNSGTLNVAVYDEDENVHSITFNFPDEVNFVDVAPFITPGVPGGWFRLPVDPEVSSVAYSLQEANTQDATLRWDAVFPAHRQYTNYLDTNGNGTRDEE